MYLSVSLSCREGIESLAQCRSQRLGCHSLSGYLGSGLGLELRVGLGYVVGRVTFSSVVFWSSATSMALPARCCSAASALAWYRFSW